VKQHGFGKIAVRVEQCQAGAGGEIVRDQV
jgi:hypothetical protein